MQKTSEVSGSAGASTLRLLSLVYFATFIGESIWRSTIHNYSVSTFHVDATQTGILFSLAAVPGLMAFAVGIVAQRLRLSTLLLLPSSLVGLGLVGMGLAPSWHGLLPAVVLVSTGFIGFYAVVNSLCLLDSPPDRVAIELGRLKSFGPLASIGAGLLIYVLLDQVGTRTLLVIVGISVLLCGVIATAGIRKKVYAVDHGELRFSATLWPYYVLNFLAGCRSAVFKAFVLLLLIKDYGLEIHGTAVLVVVSHLCGSLGYRLVGRLATRYEPRNVLSGLYAVVVVTFASFAFLANNDFLSKDQTLILLQLLFVLDAFVFGASVVTDSYLKQKSEPQDFVGDVGTGQALFYLAGVLVPFVGGVLWDSYGNHAPFLLGSALAGLAWLVSRSLVTSRADG